MAKKLTSEKAKEILRDKSVHGKPLTEKQKKFFGAIAGGAKPYKAEEGGWLDKYEQGGLVLKQKTTDNYGKKPNANESNVTLPPGFKGWAYNTKGRNYSPAWGGQFQNGGQASADSVRHQANKILQYEQLRGGPGGAPLPYYSDPKYMNMLMGNIYPEVKKILPNASAMEVGEAMDFIFNAGWDQANSKILKDPRAYALQEYYKQYDPSKLDAEGKWSGRKNAAYSFDQEYNTTIGKLPENERRILMNKGRDWYYRNINNPAPGVPSSNYYDTWYGRIWNTNDYQPFNPNNPKFIPKKQTGGILQPPMAGANQTVPMAQNGGKKEKLKPIKQVYSDNTYVKSKPYIGLDDVYDARISDEKTAKTFLNQYYDWATNNHPFYRDLTGLDSFNVQRDYRKKNKAEADRLNKEVLSDLPVDIINKKYDTLFYRQGDGEFIGDPSLKTLYKKEMANAYQDFRRKPVSSLNAPDTLVFHRGYVRGDEGLLGQHDPLKNITDVSDLDRLQTLVHERAHKADASKRMKGVANESLDNFVKLKNYDISDDAYLDSDRLEYLRHFSERQARHRSTQFWLNKNMPGYDFKKPITEKEYDFLIKNQSKIPSDVKDLLRLYGDKENFIKYSNRFEMGGSLPGATGMMYARTINPAPSNGPYAKKTKASAQNGQEMKYYQEGLDFKPKTISQNGSAITTDINDYRRWQDSVRNYIRGQKDLAKARTDVKKNINTFSLMSGSGLVGAFSNLIQGDIQGKRRFLPEYKEQSLPRQYWGPEEKYPQVHKDVIVVGDPAFDTSKRIKGLTEALSQNKNLTGTNFYPYSGIVEIYHPPVRRGLKYQPPVKKKQTSVTGTSPVVNIPRRGKYVPIPKEEIDLGYELPVPNAPSPLKASQFENKPTKYTFTYPTGKYNEQKTMYFPSKSALKSFVGGIRDATYQEGADYASATGTLQDGGYIPVDPMGYWNPENVGNPVIIPSNIITMEGVDQPLLGISDTGDVQYMMPGEDYEFDGEYVTEYPMAKKGISVNNADAQPLKKLDQLLNFTNYNKPTKGGWLDKYQ